MSFCCHDKVLGVPQWDQQYSRVISSVLDTEMLINKQIVPLLLETLITSTHDKHSS